LTTDASETLQAALDYHERTKHQLHAFARSLGYLDWATQPDPFRRFDDAPKLPLADPPLTAEPLYDALFTPGRIAPRSVNLEAVSRLFRDSLALSAWKEAGLSRWSLRINPSSGDLHPTEGYLIAGPIAGLSTEAGVYHYNPFEHALEQRLILAPELWEALAKTLPDGGLLVGLTSIYWRESWKYGERAFRYCQHDVGHAIGAITLAAAALGWRTRLLTTVADAALAQLLGVDRQSGSEAEHPDCLLAVLPNATTAEIALTLPDELLEQLTTAAFAGTPNRLSDNHHAWPVIDEVAAATRYPGASPTAAAAVESSGKAWPERAVAARQMIHQRRSAVAMDGQTSIERSVFYHLLARVTPALSPVPFQPLSWPPQTALALFVHRVRELEPGLYILVRDPAQWESLQAALDSDFLWQTPPACPSKLPLYLLQAGDARKAAKTISCHQDIAADGAFSLGMLARFEPSLREFGAWFYPRLFWETGVIGQVLYLEAEAAGVRATGIGCFFDDAMHRLLGITGRTWQSLYHFTVGGPVEDSRLRTLQPYFHLGRRQEG